MKTFFKILLFFIIFLIFIFIAISLSIFYLNTTSQSLILKNNYNSNNVNISNSENIINNESKTVILQTPEDKSFSMSVIGDIMCYNTQFKDAYSNGSYDFSYVFTDIKDYIQSSDISIGNLETTFAGSEKRI